MWHNKPLPRLKIFIIEAFICFSEYEPAYFHVCPTQKVKNGLSLGATDFWGFARVKI
jgi:hypothetical protein